ncbi:cyclic nucleotide-binding domain-containing protein [Streptomyces sp. SID8379]|uniref:Crp/Fnr family transcriptional regulator n=1 Tax=unclassified Streptomyces TaxID=2593676 RepID=UPI000364C73B|nr:MULTISPECIES: cyclic nucleotide-binding domain-containing protein [unclassified Streptomyces]MYW66972.1 cyclic nucleotide-binding domain-containing protein [Streptomyces sp. SID8379]
MTTTTAPRMSQTLPEVHRGRLMRIARDVAFPQGARLFEEGSHADRFWIVRSGSVQLDPRVPGRGAPVVESLGCGELVGWSWLFPSHVWQWGAQAETPVRADEFDAFTVRLMCASDPGLGCFVAQWVGQALAHRLTLSRGRLLDLYAPYGSGVAPYGEPYGEPHGQGRSASRTTVP